MRDLLDCRDPRGHGLALWVLAGLLFSAPLLLWTVRDVRLQPSDEAWLPDDHPDARAFTLFTENFPHDDRILVAWEGGTLDDFRIPALRSKLLGRIERDGVRRGGAEQIASVLTPQDLLEQFTGQGVSADDALRRLEGVLIGTGHLKVRLTDAGRAARERTIQMLTARAQSELGVAIETSDPLVVWHGESEAGGDVQPNTATTDAPAVAITLPIPEHDLQVNWRGMRPGTADVERFREIAGALRGFATLAEPEGQRLVEDCLFAPGSPVGLEIRLSEAGAADRESALAAIRQAAIDVGVPADALHLGGRPVVDLARDRAARSGVNPTVSVGFMHERSTLLTAGLVIIGLTLLVLRDARPGLLVGSIAAYAALLELACISLSGQALTPMLFVPLIAVLALVVSGAVFQSTCWNHNALEPPETVHSVQQARRPLIVAGLLIVTAFLPLLASSQVPVRRLGMNLVAGSLLAMGLLLYVVPALLQTARSRRPVSDDGRRWRGLATLLARSPRLIAAGSLVLLIAGAAGLSRFRSETGLLRDLERDSPVAQDFSFLEGMLTGTTPVEMIVRFSPEAQRQQRFIDRLEIVRNVEQQVRRHPAVTGALSQADFLPVQQQLAADAPTRERVLYNRRSNELERRVKGDADLAAGGFLRTAAHSRGAVESPADSAAAGDELWRISARAVLGDRLDAGQLAAELGDSIRSGLRYHPGADHCLAAPALLAHRSEHALLRSLLWRLGMAAGIAGIVLLCSLRSARATGWVMLPLLLPTLSVLGLRCWRGQPIDAQMVATASVALVLGMYHAAHLLSWFRDGLDRGGSRAQSLLGTLQFCGPSVWQSGVILGGGLLVLSAGPWLPLSRCAGTTVELLALTVFSQMIFLPALLAGPLGAALERTLAARRVREESTQATGATPAPHVRLTAHLQRDVARHAG